MLKKNRLLSRLLLSLVLALAVGSIFTGNSQAKSRVIKQKSSKGANLVSLGDYLFAGHRYRIDIRSSKPHPFVFRASEIYRYVVGRAFRVESKFLYKTGKSPASITVKQQVSGRVLGWGIQSTTVMAGAKHFTVRLVDLGKTK